MVKDAEANAAADKERRESVEVRNNAEALIHGTEKSISENEEIIDAADKEAAEAAIAGLKTALEADDKADIEAKAQALSQAAMKIGETVYKAQQAEGEAAAAADATDDAADNDDGNVVDADFEEVSDDDAQNDQKAS